MMAKRFRFDLLLGLALVSGVSLLALISIVWTPYDHTVISVADRFKPPSSEHWLGTDNLGRDVMTLIMIGARNSMIIALFAVGLGAAIGIALGVAASAIGGLFEDVIMRLADFFFAFPALLFAIMLAAAFGPSLTNAVIAIAFVNIPTFIRVSRATANQIFHQQYVLAARAAGRGRLQIVRNHVLPNILAILIVQATIDLAVAILAEAALSYLGLGVQPPHPSWGRMLAEAQTLLYLAPQLAIIPGVCIFLTVLGFNVLGDSLRDLTDPRMKRGGG